ncbi:dTDP-3-amino-3,6-dideoxy-alpha-D-galactopyranose transaminase [Pseudobythopirellula maris]|uniref:dTDP-3-amino-3,6-dideoxy-alpha-D-galactopyranose transaminase n=1 Tax=Pseudobythopirellula maris TaxID=2527991 RepID=A0A5C5ZQL1_9BACT|nr:DegT/DnrJ/EryC1/StrS family aminotransferase [Pseudobythopirellula maris]TWT89824.1 dTDP-3-amino-3,6-dideoxy-alpha-D-galactopyranose transaminase [Pseudobythopirellula maris]
MAVKVPFVDLLKLDSELGESIGAAIAEVLHSKSFIGGPHVERFERDFAHYCGVGHCIGVSNGSDALFLALRALGVGEGDEVITTPLSFVATLQAILRVGAYPRFVDVDPQTLNIDASKLESCVTARTRALLPVHLYGLPADMEAINQVAAKHGIKVIEDAAQAHGAVYQGRRVGALSDAACFSFYPTKNLAACGDGGAVTTDDAELAERIRSLANHGRDAAGRPAATGYNCRLDAVQAAVLSVKLRRLDGWNVRRREIAARYDRMLHGLPLRTISDPNGTVSAHHLFTIMAEPQHRDSMRDHLLQQGIEARVFYDRLLTQATKNLSLSARHSSRPDVVDGVPVAESATRSVLSLPNHPALTSSQVDSVIEAVRGYYRAKPVERLSMGVAEELQGR